MEAGRVALTSVRGPHPPEEELLAADEDPQLLEDPELELELEPPVEVK